MQPDGRAAGAGAQFHLVADLVDKPEAVAPARVGGRRLAAHRHRIGDHAAVADFADDLPCVGPDQWQ
jgi:hypothetical protein